jgi:hypothetical protein
MVVVIALDNEPVTVVYGINYVLHYAIRRERNIILFMKHQHTTGNFSFTHTDLVCMMDVI